MFSTPEYLSAALKNKEKSITAGITVAWGIMLLIILAGTGQGLQNGIKKIFSDYTIKTIEVYAGEASISDIGITKGDLLSFSNLDTENCTTNFSEIQNLSPIVDVQISKINSVRKNAKYFSLLGVNDEYFKIKPLKFQTGRVFNNRDMNRKVVILGHKIAQSLFNNVNCVGKLIFINNTGYKVIGVTKEDNIISNVDFNVYIPYEKALNILLKSTFNSFIFSLKSNSNSEEFEKTIKAYLANKKGINPRDKTAIYFNNVESSLKSFYTLFNAINLFLWFMGTSFLISGMLSIFNIMTIIVKERTGEFGIRKALGATPKSIQNMILMESLLITLISGTVGLILGFSLIYIINLYVQISGGYDQFFFIDVNFYIISIAMLLLIISGCIAGILPARKASKILPVEALKKLNN
ncbi:MAG: ABC transporter permease [Flavobacteriaceae bacterium]|nr:ABC transporter permease [Flavobacteriaceae bacterium]